MAPSMQGFRILGDDVILSLQTLNMPALQLLCPVFALLITRCQTAPITLVFVQLLGCSPMPGYKYNNIRKINEHFPAKFFVRIKYICNVYE